jgi:hypothetical protein
MSEGNVRNFNDLVDEGVAISPVLNLKLIDTQSVRGSELSVVSR